MTEIYKAMEFMAAVKKFSPERLKLLAERYRTKAKRADESHESTGITRYHRECQNAEELADIIEFVLGMRNAAGGEKN